MRNAVIVDIVRTPTGKGKAGGGLSQVHPAALLAGALETLLSRQEIDPSIVDDVIAGCVTQVGDQSLNVARTAVLAAGLPESVPATTVDRQCGSSQQAVHFAAQGVMAGAYEVVVACGVESMSRTPMFSNTQGGDPHGPLVTRYPEGLVQQGVAAEMLAKSRGLTREDLDAYAARSHQRAAATAVSGGFAGELVAVSIDGVPVLTADETIRPQTTMESIGTLPPAFQSSAKQREHPDLDWVVTAGNSSPLSDGASACLIMSEERAVALGLTPRARFRSFAVTGSDPRTMLDGVIPATQMALERARLQVEQIDAFEVNEAFASVPLAWAREYRVDPERLNPRGGAIALGHPLGASGIRLLATLVNYLEATGGRFGLQTMCEAGGMANATVIEA